MDYNKLNIPNIYDLSSKLPLIKTLEIYFHTYDNYDIIINGDKFNYDKINNKQQNYIVSFDILKKYFKFTNKYDTVFYVQTNCNNALYIEKNYEIDSDNYNLFDGYSNILYSNTYIKISNIKNCSNNLCNKYIKLYFYNFKYYFNELSLNYDNNISYAKKSQQYNHLGDQCDYIDILKYFYFVGHNINDNISNNNYDNSNDFTDNIIKIKLLDNNKLNPFDIICIINILKNFDDTITIIITPIKIIDNFSYYEIKLFDNTCKECEFNNNNKFKKYYSKCILTCDKHSINIEKKLLSLTDYDNEYIIDINDMFNILKVKYNISIKPKVYNILY
jgi:hypothetical protein